MPKMPIRRAGQGEVHHATNPASSGLPQPTAQSTTDQAIATTRATRGMFDESCDCFSAYQVEIQIRDRICGGVPMDAKTIEGWIRSKMGLSDETETRRKVAKTLEELGYDLPENLADEQLEEAIEKVVGEKHTNGFKRDQNGLYIEGRQLMAMFKEEVNILYAGERWGPTKKGPKSFVAERVSVPTEKVYLGRTEADGVHLFVGHVTGPAGPQATLTRYQYCEQPTMSFIIYVLRTRAGKDTVDPDEWPFIWRAAQENGMGALRSQSFGKFWVTGFTKITNAAALERIAAAHDPAQHLPEGDEEEIDRALVPA